jgi:hypothetical protein
MSNGTGWKEEYLNENGKMQDGSEDKERQFFSKLASEIKDVVRHDEKANGQPMRANHANILAGVSGTTFRISPDLPKDLTVGFLIPNGQYETELRFSNANGVVKTDDSDKDLRGAAIRVKTPFGDHEFLMTNAEPHHAKDAREAMAAVVAGTQEGFLTGILGRLGEPHHVFLKWLEELAKNAANAPAAILYLFEQVGVEAGIRILKTLHKQMGQPVESLATETFWSRAPIAIGAVPDPNASVAVKYKLEPVATKSDPAEPNKNLAEELTTRLKGGPIKFLFRVQRYVSPGHDTPIEDASVAWTSDYQTIAELIIPRDAKFDDNSIDRSEFNPWHVDLNSFRPLGSMNRARKIVYEASAGLRRG